MLLNYYSLRGDRYISPILKNLIADSRIKPYLSEFDSKKELKNYLQFSPLESTLGWRFFPDSLKIQTHTSIFTYFLQIFLKKYPSQI